MSMYWSLSWTDTLVFAKSRKRRMIKFIRKLLYPKQQLKNQGFQIRKKKDMTKGYVTGIQKSLLGWEKMNRELLFTVSFCTRTMAHQGKLAESSLKMSKRRCSSEDTVKMSKTVPLGTRGMPSGFFGYKKPSAQKQRKRFQTADKHEYIATDWESSWAANHWR